MLQLKSKVLIWVFLSSWFSAMGAQASWFSSSKSDQDFSWLRPGFEAVIMPAANSGQSITIRDDVQGITLCATIPNASDGSISGPTHCNLRITPVGYHIPPNILFDQSRGFFHALEQKLKEIGEFALAAAPMALAAFDLGATSQGAQAITNVVSPDPIDRLEAEYAVDRSLDNVAHYAQKTAQDKHIIIPVGFIRYDFSDILASLIKKVNDYVGDCDESDDKTSYCYQQKANATFAANIMGICNIPEVPSQAGEVGQPVLWTPDQPLPQGCPEQLKALGPQGELLAQWLLDGGLYKSSIANTVIPQTSLK